jgi:5'-deoxynucleotidase YfbR-like HD superfamily hydrolase
MFESFKLDKIKDVLEFARKNNRMSYLIRYNTTPHLLNESVAEHSFHVSIVTLFLYEKYKNIFNLDFEKIIKTAICHDEPESAEYIGDVPRPIKENNPELQKALEMYELKAMEELMGKEYVEYLKEFNEGKTIESLIVKLADTISCLIYSESEINKGNKYMERVKFESQEIIIKLIDRLDELENARK